PPICGALTMSVEYAIFEQVFMLQFGEAYSINWDYTIYTSEGSLVVLIWISEVPAKFRQMFRDVKLDGILKATRRGLAYDQ
ncbi:hypothetical protein HAX54_034149, partial [Datura stramonium]|nr:hypothetical protein [Datura stramonium]